MHLLLATFKHETNTFSPQPTEFPEFFRFKDTPLVGKDAIQARRGTGSGIGGYIDYLESVDGVSFDVAVTAEARPGGIVTSDAYERITNLITDALKEKHYDGILLDLHGAMVTEGFEDGEGELLDRLRTISPDIPIGVTLDMHANNYPSMIDKVTVLTGYHTYPHVDIHDAGHRCAVLLVKTIRGEITPKIGFGSRPMLPHVMRQGTHQNPNRALQETCLLLEKNDCLAASFFTGFPHADIKHAGVSAVIVTDSDAEQAQRLCDNLLTQAWDVRSEFLYQSVPLEDSIAQAKAATQYPVVILDHCDNVSSGGTMDTTVVLAELLRQGIDDCVYFAIRDPEAVTKAGQAGVGSTVTLTLGGKARLDATGEENPSLTVTGRVRTLHDGEIILHGPMMAGVAISIGKTAVVEVDGIQVVIISGRAEPSDINCFLSLGIDVRTKKYLAIKSRVHWRAGLGDIVGTVIESDGVGITTSNYSKLTFKNIQRPMYPLDPM